jgi:hypothetical protein
MSRFAESLRQHFEARTAGRTPPPRLKNPVVSGPHRLGDSGYCFTIKQDRTVPGAVSVVWSPSVPRVGVLDAHKDAYERVMRDVLPVIAQNMPAGGIEAWTK